MASQHLANLSHAWEKYIESRTHGADPQVNLQHLEHFLCLFHAARHLQSLENRDDVKFCSDMSGASNTLAREFLTDVHQLCSAVAQRAEEEEEEEESHMAALGEYLVRGRGFLLLSTLESVIDQELTCREELLTLLLSLLPLVWRIPVQEEKTPDFALPSLADVLVSQEGKAGPLRAGQERDGSDPQDSGRRSWGSWKARRQRRAAQRYSVRDARKSQLSTSDSDAESEDRSAGPGSKHRRAHGVSLQASGQNQQPEVPQPAQPAAADAMSALEKAEPRPRLFSSRVTDSDAPRDPAALSVFIRADNSPFDLCRVLLSLLEKVCKFDTSLNHNPALAVSVVPTLTEMLTEFGDCCGPGGGGGGGADLAGGWTEEPIALVQRMLLRTILHLMSLGAGQGEAPPDHLRQNLTDLLRATLKIRACLERQADPFAPRPKRTLQEVLEDFSFSRYRHRAMLLPDLLEGVLQILLGCLQSSAPNPFFFSQAVELVHEFVRHRGLELLEAGVLRLEALGCRDSAVTAEASDRARALVEAVMRIISAVKKVKAEQLHQSVCARRRHRRCQYSHFLHHHRDLSGLPASAFWQAAPRSPFEEEEEEEGAAKGTEAGYPERCCCLAACAHQCLHLLERLPSGGSTSLQILAGLQAVGVCCCMDPRSVVGPLLHAFRAPGLRSYQAHVLAILSRLLLEQLGGGQLSERARQASCNICEVDGGQLPRPDDAPAGNGDPAPASSSSSPSCRPQGILPNRGAENALLKWAALEAYRDLAFGEDRQLSLQIAGHVCHLALRGNAAVQWQLYTRIFSPALQRGVELAHRAHEAAASSASAQACSSGGQSLPVEVLQVYLQALPALLKSRLIRDLLLSSNGLNQVIELLYLDQLRSPALRVFETLILTLEAEQDGAQEQGGEEGEAEPDLRARGGGDGPQSLSKFYEGLRGACPRQRGKGGASHGAGGAHLDAISLFLCVAFLSVSKEADSDRDSANDSEDTSGYDSTASEPLGARPPCLCADSVAPPPREQARRAADVWSACRRLCLSSAVFQRQLHRLGGLEVCSRLATMVIQKLAFSARDGKARRRREAKGRTSPSRQGSPGPAPDELQAEDTAGRLEEEWPLQSVRLLEALLAISLHSASSALQRVDPDLSFQLRSVEETLGEVRDQLSRSGVVNSDLAIPLFDSLLRVALAEVSPGVDTLEEKAERQKLHSSGEAGPPAENSSQDVDEPEDCVLRLPGEEGYEADSESNLEGAASREEGAEAEADPSGERALGAEAEGPGRRVLQYPEICSMELLLLSTGAPDPEVLAHVFRSLLQTVRDNPRNATLLYQQGTVKTILGGFRAILSQSDSSSKACQAVLVELLVAMVSVRITAEELALLVQLFLEKTPPTEILLNGMLQIVEANMDMEPLQFLSFPLVPSASSPSGLSPGPRQNRPAGGKAPGTPWRGKLSPGRREGDGEGPGHQLTSSWLVAPIHLPLVGQNCWPHMADGFSTSLWLRAQVSTEEDSPIDKGKRQKRRSGVLRDSSVDSIDGGKSPRADVLNAASSGDRVVGEGSLHIISMGSKALMLQVWADLSAGAFTFRICVDPNDDVKVGLLAQAESPKGLLQPGRWQHLAFTYTQQPEGKKHIHGKLALWVCGVRKCEVSLDYTPPRRSSLSADSNRTVCMLGHRVHSLEELSRLGGCWDIGSLLLFNGSRIGSEEAFYLYASGPDFTSIMPCKYGKPGDNFSKYVTREGLQCNQVRELLMKNMEVDTGPLIVSAAVLPGSASVEPPCLYVSPCVEQSRP